MPYDYVFKVSFYVLKDAHLHIIAFPFCCLGIGQRIREGELYFLPTDYFRFRWASEI